MANFGITLSETQFTNTLKAMVTGAGNNSTKQNAVDDWVDKMEAGSSGLTASVNWTAKSVSVNWTGGDKPFELSLSQSSFETIGQIAADGADASKYMLKSSVDDWASESESGCADVITCSVNWTSVTFSVNWT